MRCSAVTVACHKFFSAIVFWMLNIYGLVFWLIIDDFDYVVYFLKNSHHTSLSNKRAKVQKFLLYITLEGE